MHWALILLLSGFGILMGVASVLGLTVGIEGWLWLVIALLCIVVLRWQAPGRMPRHAFLVGLIGGGVAPLVQSVLFATYMTNNPQLQSDFAQLPGGLAPRYFMVLLAPVAGLLSGAVLAAATWLSARLFPEAVNVRWIRSGTEAEASRVPDDFQFRAPWHRTDRACHDELRRELSRRHQLHGITARAVARRQDNDDVLFELFGSDAPAAFAVVHLTWSGHPDQYPDVPSTELYPSFAQWVADCMTPDADQWDLPESASP